MAPGQETNLAHHVRTRRRFGSKCTVLKNKTCDIVGTFRCPQWFSDRNIMPPSLRPWFDTSQQSAQLRNSQSPECWTTFSELRDHNYVSSAMYLECPTKDWWGKLCWLNPLENNIDVVQDPGGVTASPTLLSPVLVWSQQNYLKLLVTVRYSKSS